MLLIFFELGRGVDNDISSSIPLIDNNVLSWRTKIVHVYIIAIAIVVILHSFSIFVPFIPALYGALTIFIVTPILTIVHSNVATPSLLSQRK